LDNVFKTKFILIHPLEEGPIHALFYTGSLVSALKPYSEQISWLSIFGIVCLTGG